MAEADGHLTLRQRIGDVHNRLVVSLVIATTAQCASKSWTMVITSATHGAEYAIGRPT
jgi:hypothetical protein